MSLCMEAPFGPVQIALWLGTLFFSPKELSTDLVLLTTITMNCEQTREVGYAIQIFIPILKW